MHTTERFLPPGKPYLLGTDNFGRDIFSRIMKGTQTAFLVGAISVLIGLVIGVCLGALSGYFGGWFDRIIAQLNATIQAFPGVLLALMIVAVFGPGTINTIVALSITAIPGFTRITRSGFLQFKEYSFVEAAETIGLGPLSIMIRHILPPNRTGTPGGCLHWILQRTPGRGWFKLSRTWRPTTRAKLGADVKRSPGVPSTRALVQPGPRLCNPLGSFRF